MGITNGNWTVIGRGQDGFLIGNENYNRDIATVWQYDSSESERKESEANAKLISKAPEMLKVLQGVYNLRPIIEWSEGEDNEYTWNGEAEAINNMFNEIQRVIKEAIEL